VSRPATAAIAATADPTPTPAPTSEERCTSEGPSPAGVAPRAELLARFAHCRSLDELPPELRDNPWIRRVVGMTPEEEARERAAVAAQQEADALYGDDPERILAAIEAGTHPLQRRLPARG
jgi:hypothetical protein